MKPRVTKPAAANERFRITPEMGEAYEKRKKQTTVRLDDDVLDWLKSKGAGHISRVNSILRAVMLAEQKR